MRFLEHFFAAWRVDPSSIPSAESFGTPAITAVIVYPASIPSAEAFGVPELVIAGTPTTSRGRAPLAIPKVYWTAEGRAIDLEDWMATSIIGGHDTAHGRLRETQARRVEPDALLAAWTDGGADPIWEGPATDPPLVRDGFAEIVATGHKEKAEKAFGRLLFQARDYGAWTEVGAGPHSPSSYTASADRIQTQLNAGWLYWLIQAEEVLDTGHANGFVFWAPGARITRYAFSIVKTTGDSEAVALFVFRAAGPTGGATQVVGHSLAAGGATVIDQAVTGAPDQLIVDLIPTGNFTNGGPFALALRDLRVNGIAPGDTFYTWEVVSHIAALLGWDTAGVQGSGVNALPLDVVDDSWASVLHLMDLLDDQTHFVSHKDRSSGAVKILRGPWTDVVWDTHQDGWCDAGIDPLRPIHGVVVTYDDVGGAPRQVTAGATQGSLYRESIPDVQPNGDLATSLANTLWAQAQGERYDGGSHIIGARRQDGMAEDIFRIRPGQQYRIADYGPSKDVTLRIHRTEMTQRNGVSVDTSSALSPARILALAELEGSRAPSTMGLPAIEMGQTVRSERVQGALDQIAATGKARKGKKKRKGRFPGRFPG